MLDQNCQAPFAQLIDAAPLRLETPPERTVPRGTAAATPFPFEQRQSPRIEHRRRGAMQVADPIPAIRRTATPDGILVRDVSRRGMRFLFDQQLFPGEKLRIWLPEAELRGDVMRCRRLGPRCYEVGVRLADALAPALIRQLLSQGGS